MSVVQRGEVLKCPSCNCPTTKSQRKERGDSVGFPLRERSEAGSHGGGWGATHQVPKMLELERVETESL